MFVDFECPIIDLTFLTNDIELKNHAGKSVRLDVALKLANGILMDAVELHKLRERLEKVPERQRIWVRFFLARTYAEVKQLCEQDSIIKRACEALEMVSKEDEMQDLARMIWQGEFAKRHEELLRQERDRTGCT
ncbi:MAG: hypothetical protein RL189_503 [Pseudomonadota bacterium]